MSQDQRAARTWLARGEEFAAGGEGERAADAFGRALALDPELGAASFGLATELLILGRAREALTILEEAVARAPLDAPLVGRFGDALQLTGHREEAITAYRRAVELDPSISHGWYGLGCAELAAGAHAAAIPALARAAHLRPAAAEAHFNLATALFNVGEIDRAIDALETVLRLDNEALRCDALAAIARLAPGSPRADNAEVLARRRAWAAGARPSSPLPRRPVPPLAGRKLRVGYVSAFFQGRNWMKPVWALINNHDRASFEIHIFSDSDMPPGEGGYRDHAEDYWHMVGSASNEDLARHIAELGIDILVDLNGYSAQERLPLFMHRAAPLQVSWFSMYGPSGLDCFDLLIVDDAAFPPAEEVFYSEEIVRLAGSYFTFTVDYAVPEVAPPPSTRGAPFTFGGLGSHYKLTPNVIGAWAAILRAAPQARLLVKNRILDAAANRKFLHDRFAAAGVAPERILLEGPAEHLAFLDAYARVDVALDTFPYNGGTTTIEALWQGVPVLTFDGDRWAGRTSRSILVGAQMGEWVELTLDGYIGRAIALANDPATPARLAALRAAMRDRIRAAPICDAAGYCRNVERVYREAASRCSGV